MRRFSQPPARHASLRFSQRGFARLRWIIALALLAVVAAWGLPKLLSRYQHDHSPQAVAAEQAMRGISQGLDSYRKDNGRYPSTEQGLLALVIKPTRAPVPENWAVGGYVDRLPRDPWETSYQYRASDDGTTYELFSFGEAGPNGGDDSDQVIRLH